MYVPSLAEAEHQTGLHDPRKIIDVYLDGTVSELVDEPDSGDVRGRPGTRDIVVNEALIPMVEAHGLEMVLLPTRLKHLVLPELYLCRIAFADHQESAALSDRRGNQNATVAASTQDPITSPESGTAGWAYNETTGQIVINDASCIAY